MQISGGVSRPGGAVEISVIGEAGAHAALLAADSKAIAAGLGGNNGLGSGLDLQTVSVVNRSGKALATKIELRRNGLIRSNQVGAT